jgi:hypothetical protein
VAFSNDLAVTYATAEAMQQRKAVADAELACAQDDCAPPKRWSRPVARPSCG